MDIVSRSCYYMGKAEQHIQGKIASNKGSNSKPSRSQKQQCLSPMAVLSMWRKAGGKG